MIYSTRHPKHPSAFWKFVDLECTALKLKAIGIDPKFMLFDEGGFSIENFERELAELQEDYDRLVSPGVSITVED